MTALEREKVKGAILAIILIFALHIQILVQVQIAVRDELNRRLRDVIILDGTRREGLILKQLRYEREEPARATPLLLAGDQTSTAEASTAEATGARTITGGDRLRRLIQQSLPEMELDPTVIKPGGRSTLRTRYRNPRQVETILLKATATWRDEWGNTYFTESNTVTLNVIHPRVVRLRLEIPSSAIDVVGSSHPFTREGDVLDFGETILGDGEEIVLQVELEGKK